MKKWWLIAFCLLALQLFGQELQLIANDSTIGLLPLVIHAKKNTPDRLTDTQDQVIYAGKKNEIIRLNAINANLTNNSAREIFSRIPGVSVWENDGSGIQINVAVRGLSPNRSWELNTRQNGYDISADVFGYPEAYYNPPMEAVERIVLVRGAASLAFGPQFGGMLNYVLKRENNKKISFEQQNTAGSYGLFSTFNALGGTTHKISYYAYQHYRRAAGWRENSQYEIHHTHAFISYRPTEKTKLSAEYTRMNYRLQQAGGLTDEQFKQNPQQSGRARNWFGAPWNLFSIDFTTQSSNQISTSIKMFGLLGERNSVGYTATPNFEDAIDLNSNNYNPRRVDQDIYENFGIENRNLLKYTIGKQNQQLAFGFRAYQATTTRLQNGQGSTGFSFDLNTTSPFNLSFDYRTQNGACFAEHLFALTPSLRITPGVRYEYISSTANGQLGINNNGEPILSPAQTLLRKQWLVGVTFEYALGFAECYGNIAQAYRPVLFSDLSPSAVTDVIDPNLRDASGFNADVGYRGSFRDILHFDVSIFYLQYNNRIGGLRQFFDDPTLGTYLFKTNVGQTVNKGLEFFLNLNLSSLCKLPEQYGTFEAFATMSFIDSRYGNFIFTTSSGNPPNVVITETNLDGNRVENAPNYIHQFGFSYSKQHLSATLQHRLTGAIFTDANNTVAPAVNALTGRLPAYQVTDFSMEYRFLEHYTIKAGSNNLFNTAYATRRASGYPGPGVIPSDGRTFYLSFGFKI